MCKRKRIRILCGDLHRVRVLIRSCQHINEEIQRLTTVLPFLPSQRLCYLRKLKYVANFHPYDVSFNSDAVNGNLPNYTVVEQRYMDMELLPANDDHPSHNGQMFIKEVYETLRASLQWNETLMVITYDEHGGYFDHVLTPVRGVPNPDGIVSPGPDFFDFDRLGVRVPTMVVSPWIEKGTVVHGPNGVPMATSEYEHSSISATVKNIFNLPSFLTNRDAWAGSFDNIVQNLTTTQN